ncbi:hypothetical protein OIO90_002825 [Microbotryomycetes sp. JL221]|nr:hypothetical protein OIO90_002825 [Microbotryomycetes sp. JL221]
MASWDFIQKQILLGDAGTGKSSLLVRLTDDRFLNHSEPTVGVEFGSRVVQLVDGPDQGKKVKLQIWDTAGQESFRSITRSYYRGAGGALLVFDISSRSSFESCSGWLADLRAWGEQDLIVLLVGNKGDLIKQIDHDHDNQQDSFNTTTTRAVSVEEATNWAKENQVLAGYVETSAKTGQGVMNAFDQLTRTVHEQQQKSRPSRNLNSNSNSKISLGFNNLSTTGQSKCC